MQNAVFQFWKTAFFNIVLFKHLYQTLANESLNSCTPFTYLVNLKAYGR